MSAEVYGDYIIVKSLGEGSFGEVFLAEHRFIKKNFALKILPQELCEQPDFIARFEEQVSVLATLDHPSIVKVHNISQANGQYFLVMDPIVDSMGDTINLERYLKLKGAVLSETEMEIILRQIASALDYAHEVSLKDRKLIHGSLKLSNILVGKTQTGLRLYMTDFGLAELIGRKVFLQRTLQEVTTALKEENFQVEKHRNVLRSYNFLSPEQKLYDPLHKPDLKADVYSFGVLTYYLITRSFPEGYFELPSKKAPQLRKNWNLLVCQCLHADSEKRPARLIQSLEELLKPLDASDDHDELASWEEVERRVEDVMQMSFEFANIERQIKEDVLNDEDFELDETSSGKPKPVLYPSEIERPRYEPDPGAIFSKELSVSHYQPKKIEIKEVEPLLTEMVVIPGGNYYRGSNHGARDEMPRHAITTNSFALDIHPITNEQFVRFLDAMGGEKDKNNNDIIRLRDSRIKRSGGKIVIESGYVKHPVVGVTWYGAMAYAKWVGARLPTEAEWEIAAYGGLDNFNYPTGDEIERSQANFFSSDTTSVMSYPPNGYGLYDMAGNVYEWCKDWYAYNFYDTSVQEPDNPKGPPQGVYRVLRGGCWKSLKEDLRCSHRHRNNPGTVNGTYGFRCATDVS